MWYGSPHLSADQYILRVGVLRLVIHVIFFVFWFFFPFFAILSPIISLFYALRYYGIVKHFQLRKRYWLIFGFFILPIIAIIFAITSIVFFYENDLAYCDATCQHNLNVSFALGMFGWVFIFTGDLLFILAAYIHRGEHVPSDPCQNQQEYSPIRVTTYEQSYDPTGAPVFYGQGQYNPQAPYGQPSTYPPQYAPQPPYGQPSTYPPQYHAQQPPTSPNLPPYDKTSTSLKLCLIAH